MALDSSLPSADYNTAEQTCNTVNTEMFRPRGFLIASALEYYLTAQATSKSLWVGRWEEVEADMYSAQVEWTEGGREGPGDCVIASQAAGFRWSRSDCGGDNLYFCQPRSPSCPPGYIWIPGAGLDSCFKFLPGVGYKTSDNKMEQSISTASKVCLGDKTSLAAPDTTEQLLALAQWLQYSDRILHGEYEDQGETPRLFLGYRFAAQSATTPGICDSCTWPDYYYSPWATDITATRPTNVASSAPHKSCQIIQRKQDPTTAVQEFSCYKSEAYNEDSFLGAMCEYRQCKISTTEVCVFPFKYAGRWYDKCTTAGRGDQSLAAWCSLKVDSEGVHIPGNEAICPATCPTTNCPIGFWPHLKTCLQVSSSVPEDSPASVEEAESRCMSQGGRLYQPRSTRSLQLLLRRSPEFFHASNSAAGGILSWDLTSKAALGVKTVDSDPSFPLNYRDNSAVPAGLSTHSKGLAWSSNFPSGTGTCVNWQNKFEMANMACDGYGSSSSLLSYVCEARPMTTTDTFIDCPFPYKLDTNGSWQHSCQYASDNNKPYAWCPTQLDSEGVAVADQVGLCDDERNTAYAGPDADNTCKIPFFYNGVWFENCTLYPFDTFWCPTKVDEKTREMDGKLSYTAYSAFKFLN